jgi:hypothetical protein
VINLKTAKALGPTIAPSLLGRAMPAGGDAHAICGIGSWGGCGIGSWGGRCPSLVDYVIGTRATSGEPAAGGHSFCLSSILATLEATAQVFGEREIVMAWEMTKQFKEILGGPPRPGGPISRRPGAGRVHADHPVLSV